jgi:hypothetical protein
MSFIGRIIDWMGEHKIATAGIAAGVGYLAISKTANANPALPGTSAQILPGGGIQNGPKVIPPPNLINTVKTVLRVTTQDPAPAGNLMARANNGTMSTNPIIGYFPKDGLVEMLDPGNENYAFVRGPGVGPNGPTTLEAWASKLYLRPAN